MTVPATPPATVEGWYALHQIYRIIPAAFRETPAEERAIQATSLAAALDELAAPVGGGWTVVAELTGSVADVMFVHFRPTLEALREAQRRLLAEPLLDRFEPVYSFLSITEAGLYQLTATVARERARAGVTASDAEGPAAVDALATRVAAERETPFVTRRLYPPLPADMPFISFYPMSKRRAVGQNWYALSLEERSRLMQAHGLTGRRYHGRVQQIITGAIGLDAWEWGVTLFARDPLEFKRLVTDMRFDEVSAQYADFGAFYVGEVLAPAAWVARLP